MSIKLAVLAGNWTGRHDIEGPTWASMKEKAGINFILADTGTTVDFSTLYYDRSI